MREGRLWSVAGLAGLLVAAVSGQAVLAPTPQRIVSEGLEGPVKATVERVIDGDTIEVRAFIWLGQSLLIRVRIDGVDAPELEARCSQERERSSTPPITRSTSVSCARRSLRASPTPTWAGCST